MTTALFLLRCTQAGISLRDLDLLSIGSALDMLTELANDNYDWKKVATQDDFDKF